MERRIITVFCLIDEYLKLIGMKEDVRTTVSNAEILLIGIILCILMDLILCGELFMIMD